MASFETMSEEPAAEAQPATEDWGDMFGQAQGEAEMASFENFAIENSESVAEASQTSESDWNDLFSESHTTKEESNVDGFAFEASESVPESSNSQNEWEELFAESSANGEQNDRVDSFDDFFNNNSKSEAELLEMYQKEAEETSSQASSTNGHSDLNGLEDLFGDDIYKSKEEKM
jgi:hypothetical protein